jgi:hypothetical protein
VKLAGATTHPPIGAGGVGDTRPGTIFVFVVPALPTGTHSTYSQCRGSEPAFSGFEPGATTFTVDPPLPATDTANSPTASVAWFGPLTIVAWFLATLLVC